MKTTANGPVGTVNPLVPKDRRKHYTAPVRPGNALPGAAGIPLARRTAEGRDQPVRPLVPGSGAKLTNNASQAAIVRQGNRTTLTLSNNYKGPPESFARNSIQLFSLSVPCTGNAVGAK